MTKQEKYLSSLPEGMSLDTVESPFQNTPKWILKLTDPEGNVTYFPAELAVWMINEIGAGAMLCFESNRAEERQRQESKRRHLNAEAKLNWHRLTGQSDYRSYAPDGTPVRVFLGQAGWIAQWDGNSLNMEEPLPTKKAAQAILQTRIMSEVSDQ